MNLQVLCSYQLVCSCHNCTGFVEEKEILDIAIAQLDSNNNAELVRDYLLFHNLHRSFYGAHLNNMVSYPPAGILKPAPAPSPAPEPEPDMDEEKNGQEDMDEDNLVVGDNLNNMVAYPPAGILEPAPAPAPAPAPEPEPDMDEEKNGQEDMDDDEEKVVEHSASACHGDRLARSDVVVFDGNEYCTRISGSVAALTRRLSLASARECECLVLDAWQLSNSVALDDADEYFAIIGRYENVEKLQSTVDSFLCVIPRGANSVVVRLQKPARDSVLYQKMFRCKNALSDRNCPNGLNIVLRYYSTVRVFRTENHELVDAVNFNNLNNVPSSAIVRSCPRDQCNSYTQRNISFVTSHRHCILDEVDREL